MFEHNRLKNVKALAKVYDYSKYSFKYLFWILILVWSYETTFLLSPTIEVCEDNKPFQQKILYILNKNKTYDYLWLISASKSIHENEIVKIYGKLRDIEVLF